MASSFVLSPGAAACSVFFCLFQDNERGLRFRAPHPGSSAQPTPKRVAPPEQRREAGFDHDGQPKSTDSGRQQSIDLIPVEKLDRPAFMPFVWHRKHALTMQGVGGLL